MEESLLVVLQHGNPFILVYYQMKSKLNFELHFDLGWTAYCLINIGHAGRYKPKQLQSVNIYILCACSF